VSSGSSFAGIGEAIGGLIGGIVDDTKDKKYPDSLSKHGQVVIRQPAILWL